VLIGLVLFKFSAHRARSIASCNSSAPWPRNSLPRTTQPDPGTQNSKLWTRNSEHGTRTPHPI